MLTWASFLRQTNLFSWGGPIWRLQVFIVRVSKSLLKKRQFLASVKKEIQDDTDLACAHCNPYKRILLEPQRTVPYL